MRKTKPPSQRRQRPDPPEAFRRATVIIVNSLRITGMDDATITTKVKAGIREALEGDKEFFKTMDLPDGGPTELLSMAGIYRIVIAEHDIDRSDQRSQERWFAVVEQALAGALRAPRV